MPVAGEVNEKEIWAFYPTFYSFAGIYWGLKGKRVEGENFYQGVLFLGVLPPEVQRKIIL